MTVRFRGWICDVQRRRYSNGRIALVLNDAEDGEQVLVATCNLPDIDVPDGHVLIKDWSENEGVLAVLVEAGIVHDTGRRIPTGFAKAALCRLDR